MSNIAYAISHPGALFHNLRNWVHSLSDTRKKYLVFRRTFRELNNLSERELDDIGLARGDIRDAAAHAAGLR